MKETYILIFKDGDFELGKPGDNDIFITINEDAEKISLTIPAGTNLLAKRTAEKKVNSIARSGYMHPQSGISKIGRGFPVEIIAEEDIEKLPASLASRIEHDDFQHEKPPGAVQALAEMQKSSAKPHIGTKVPPKTDTGPERALNDEKLGKMIHKLLDENKTVIIQKIHGVVTINSMSRSDEIQIE